MSSVKVVEAAFRSINQNYAIITDSTLDPVDFAIRLNSHELISTGTFRIVIDLTSNMNKRARLCFLLNDLLSSVSLQGMPIFNGILDCLQDIGGPVCEALVEKLRTTHKDLIEISGNTSDITTIPFNTQIVEQIVHPLPNISGVSVWSFYNSFLVAMYSRKLDAYDQWPPVHTNEYIPVVLKEVNLLDTEESIKRKAQRILSGKVNKSDHMFTDEVVSNCFAGNQARTVLIEGAPGIGKTAFSYSICQKWASRTGLQKFKAIIRWSLSDLMELDVSSVSDLIMHDSLSVKDEVVKMLCNESGDGVLFVFDGWDEISESTRKEKVDFLLDLIKGKKLPKASHIVTTRSLQTIKSFKLKRNIFDYCYEITGFSDQNIVEYINKAFSNKPKDAQLLLKQLETRPDIHSMCYIPMHCAIVAYVFLQKRKLPRTMTEFYQFFIVNSLLRNMQLRVEGGDEIDELASLNHLPKSIYNLFVKLSELAFRGLWTCKYSYSEDEVQIIASSTVGKVDRLGILQAQRIFHSKGTKLSFHFLHSSVQQFLAAYYLTSLPREEQHNYIETYIEYFSFFSVWQFFCGICTFSQLQQSGFLEEVSMSVKKSNLIDKELPTNLENSENNYDADFSRLNLDTPSLDSNDDDQLEQNQDTEVNISVLEAPKLVLDGVASSFSVRLPYGSFGKRLLLLFLKCAYECKTNFFIEFIISLCEQSLHFRNYSLKKLDMIPIGFLLQNVKGDFQLKLENCHLQVDHLSVLRHQIMLTKRPSLSINEIIFENNCLSVDGARELSKFLPVMKNCEKLNISSNEIRHEGLQYIAKTICHLSCLKELNLACNKIECIDEICQTICQLKHLTHLNFSNNPLDDKSASQLMQVLKCCRELSHLSIAKSNIGDEGVLQLVEAINLTKSIVFLDLQECGLSQAGAAYLSTVIGDSQIKELLLSSNNIEASGADLIFSSLSSNKVIERLDVSDCGISYNDPLCHSLTAFLTSAPLKKLDISHNPLQDEGLASVLTIFINNLCSVNDLNISGSNMYRLTSVALGELLLTQHSQITHLTLSGTEFHTIRIMFIENEFQCLLESISSSKLVSLTFNISEEMRSDIQDCITYIEELQSDDDTQILQFHLVVCEESITYDSDDSESIEEEEWSDDIA